MRLVLKYFLITIILFLLNLKGQSLTLTSESLTISDGLSNNVIYSIIQDKLGFIWIATQDGLNRFDGYNFKVYKNQPYKQNVLSGNWVHCLLEDEKGNLWIGSNSQGVFYFDREKNKFINYTHNVNDENSLSNNRIWDIFQDSKNNIWIGTTNGLNKFLPSEKKFKRYYNTNKLEDYAVNTIAELNNGDLLLGTWGDGIHKLILNKDKIIEITEFNNILNTELSKRIKKLIKDDSNNLWIGTHSGLYKISLNNYEIFEKVKLKDEKENLINPFIISLCESKDKNIIWIGTNMHGIFKYDKVNKDLKQINKDNDNKSITNDQWISSLFEDESGILWVGTGKGINKILVKQNNFFDLIKSSKPNIKYDEVVAILEDSKNNLWLSIWGDGLIKYNLGTKKTEKIKNGDIFKENIIWVMKELKNKKIILGSYKGIYEYGEGNDFKKFKWGDFKNTTNISAIHEDRKNNIWIATWGNGIFRLYEENKIKKIEHFKNEIATGEKNINDNFIFSIAEDLNGDIWFGTNIGGLNKYNSKTKIIETYQYNAKNKNSINNNSVKSLYVDKKNNLWIGTWGGGLNLFNINSRKFQHFTEADGLQNDIILGILEDEKNNLWISTSKGISKFLTKEKLFINFDKQDGVESNQFSQGYLKLKNNLFIFGSIDGLICFYPNKIKFDNFNKKTLITSIKLMGEEKYSADTLRFLEKIEINYKENRIEFNLSSMDYLRANKNRFIYKLKKLDDKWQITNEPKVIYSNLSQGNYTFEVKSINRDGSESEYITSLDISVSAPFWKTWWFYFILFLITISLIILFYKQKIKQIKKIERIRKDIASDLHDEVGSSLTRIALYSDASIRYLDKKTTESLEESKSYLNEIGTSSRELIASISDIVWAVNPLNDYFENIILRLKNYVSKILPLNSVDYDINVNKEIETLCFSMEFRRNFFLIMKEVLNNIVKHSKASYVIINLEKEKDRLKVVIFDNGIGFDTSKLSDGNGLRNINTRIKTLNGTCEINSVIGEGTSIKFDMKILAQKGICNKYINFS